MTLKRSNEGHYNFFLVKYLGEFRQDFTQNGGMDPPVGLMSKNDISGLSDDTETGLNAIYSPFMNRFTSGLMFWNQHSALHRFLLILPVGSRDRIRLLDAISRLISTGFHSKWRNGVPRDVLPKNTSISGLSDSREISVN